MLDLTYYKRLITSEYRRSTNFTAMVERLLSYGLDLDSSATDLITAFEVDYATTAQLDILGAIVGVSRQLSFEPSAAATGDIVCRHGVSNNQPPRAAEHGKRQLYFRLSSGGNERQQQHDGR